MSEKTRALLFLDRLTPEEKERLENDLTMGVFDWREYLTNKTHLYSIGEAIDLPSEVVTALISIAERCDGMSEFCKSAGRPQDIKAGKRWLDMAWKIHKLAGNIGKTIEKEEK